MFFSFINNISSFYYIFYQIAIEKYLLAIVTTIMYNIFKNIFAEGLL